MADVHTIGTGSVNAADFWSRVGAWCGWGAGILNLIGFVWYCTVVLDGSATTNAITWWMLLGETLVSLALLKDRTGDPATWFTEFVSMIGVGFVSLYLVGEVFLGAESVVLASVETIDIVFLVLTLAVGVIWLATRRKYGAGPAIWIFQIVLVGSMIPLVLSTYEDPLSEPLGPWVLWCFVFLLQTICAKLRLAELEAYINPLNYTLTHVLVVGAILFGSMAV